MNHCTLLFACLLLPLPASARTPVFLEPEYDTHLSARYRDWQTSDLQNRAGDIAGARTRLEGGYRNPQRSWRLALGHEYNALDIEFAGPEPQTNGHLHTLHLAAGWSLQAGNGNVALTVAPAISTSSNALKNPGELDARSLQMWAAAIGQFPAGGWDWVAGIAHDYRFGESRAYPVAGAEWRGERLFFRATYPDLVLRWSPANQWTLGFSLGPDGNQWRAFDEDLEDSDDFRREAWEAAAWARYRWRNGLSLGFSTGYMWDQQWRMRLETGEQLRTRAENANFVGVELGWSRR